MSLSTLLVLADGRLPSGAHAHSGGVEAAVAAGRVHDLPTLESFLLGRTATTGVVSATFAAATCHALTGPAANPTATPETAVAGPGERVGGARVERVRDLDDGLDARTASPALRAASRAQGRAVLRAATRIWPAGVARTPALGSVHHPTAIGIAAAAAGLEPAQAGLVAVYGGLTGAASAAVRLLGLDPYAVHGLVAALAHECDRVAADAAGRVDDPVDDLPAGSAPLLDVDAEHHATWEVRLFAS
ncbi:urease accessory UreF family protein [Asanoa sp. NPDC049573]|uniref:urease accessory protein UreF n=1 Tax=Asanoa sp. NPDC049573 TaxID=3155396 RepID=UPI003411FF04